ncbi:MAG TPA: TatD family hydrolase [Paludibacteraceae bacterium]|nr:TatD family hydrolase [Paludibacteraceae bacterium]HQF50528.1 TatD family hydrolase [Paludibacteraceae bacterium]HQJ90743.1 TatD family hydrolase [Paludibacteraceae bacterium]
MYINIHTHKVDERDDVKCIVNLPSDVKEIPDEGRFSVGVHPWDVDHLVHAKLSDICRLLQERNVVAIGEIGLDQLSENGYERQETVFETQIKMANLLQKPIIIHCVKAYNEIVRYKGTISVPAIIHGFRGKPQLADQLCRAGYFISFGNKFNEESLIQTPTNRLFLETDDDEEADIKEIYERVAALRNCSVEELKKQIERNYEGIFCQRQKTN